MARLPAAPGAYGQPPVPPVDASKQRTPASRPATTLASAVPRVSWKWNAIRSSGMPAAIARPVELRDLARHADADRVAEADLVDAELERAAARPRRRAAGRRRRCTGSRTRSRRSRGATSRARPPGARTGSKAASDSSMVMPMLRVGEGVGRRGEDGERVGAGGLGAGHAAHVRDEDRVADAAALAAGAAAARRRRPAGGWPSARRSSSPRSRGGRPRRGARCSGAWPRAGSAPPRSGARRAARPRRSGRDRPRGRDQPCGGCHRPLDARRSGSRSGRSRRPPRDAPRSRAARHSASGGPRVTLEELDPVRWQARIDLRRLAVGLGRRVAAAVVTRSMPCRPW